MWFRSAIGAISFECESGRILEFAQMVHHPSIETNHSSPPRVLLLQAPLLPSEAFSYNSEKNTWMIYNEPAQLNLSQGSTSPSDFWRELQEGGRWQCIVLGDWFGSIFVMILESHHGFASRAGMFRFFSITVAFSEDSVLNTVQRTLLRIE